jgi:lipopolysaccharide biosynthesis protein
MSNETARVRALAFYLPQFHPVPENDEWWGPGFTEWTNVARARPLFPGHYQPRIPGELGFYDLRLEETRVAQAQLAREHGISGFCYWHYWFAGRRMLNQVVDDVVCSGVPDLPFCIGWANETWGGRWVGAKQPVLIEQTYPGDDDHRRHFDALAAVFHDARYVRVDDRPLFYVYRPEELPDAARFADLWRELAAAAGLPGLFLVGQSDPRRGSWRPTDHGFDAAAPWERFPFTPALRREGKWHLDWLLSAISYRLPLVPKAYSYARWSRYLPTLAEHELSFPSVLPGWDNTPRAGRDGSVYHGATPEAFADQVEIAVKLVEDRARDHRIVFIRSWNEWAEGNYLEPDRRFGRAFLEAFRDVVLRSSE